MTSIAVAISAFPVLEFGLSLDLPIGPSGTGKTTLSMQFLCEGARRGERGLLVTVEEPPNEVKINHRGLDPPLAQVYVFDAIPDIMRYERVPFKDIAAVRTAQAFATVPFSIRQSPELSSVEVTLAGLEQMLRSEVAHKHYSRIAIDSLTALQYFCMKGFDPVAGSQTFLRFLSDLRVTTLLTVEAPLEDVETAERALARGEIRLFRWEHENRTVRAIGVEKFRGSSHDVRLHPYRIGPRGVDINLVLTISRDTRQIIEPAPPAFAVAAPTPIPLEEVVSPVDPLADEVRDLVLVGTDVGPVRAEIESAIDAVSANDLDVAQAHLARASALVIALSAETRPLAPDAARRMPEVAEAAQRLVQRGESARAGLPPTRLPPPKALEIELRRVLSLIPPAVAAAPTAVEPEVASAAPEPVPQPPLVEQATVRAAAPPIAVDSISPESVPTDRGGVEPTTPAPIAPVVVAPTPEPEPELAGPAEAAAAEIEPAAPLDEEPTGPEEAVLDEAPVRAALPEPPRPIARGSPSPTLALGPDAGAARAGRAVSAATVAPEDRPPLPSFGSPAPRPVPSSGARAVGAAPAAASVPPVPSRPGAPTGPPMPTAGAPPPPAAGTAGTPEPAAPIHAPAPAKRRRKAPATTRRKSMAPDESTAPAEASAALPDAESSASGEVTGGPKAKKRAPRKRKAPTVVGGRSGSSAPPHPSPAATEASASAPKEDA